MKRILGWASKKAQTRTGALLLLFSVLAVATMAAFLFQWTHLWNVEQKFVWSAHSYSDSGYLNVENATATVITLGGHVYSAVYGGSRNGGAVDVLAAVSCVGSEAWDMGELTILAKLDEGAFEPVLLTINENAVTGTVPIGVLSHVHPNRAVYFDTHLNAASGQDTVECTYTVLES